MRQYLVRIVAARQSLDAMPVFVVVFPQAADQLRRHQIARVLRDEPNEEEAVATQKRVDELLHALRDGGVELLRVADLLHGDEARLHVAHLARKDEEGEEPHEEAAESGERDESEPEPEEDEDLLVEEVHRQRALHRVAVDVADVADLEVAKGDAREAVRRRPLLAARHLRQHPPAVLVEVHAEEDVQQADLREHVADVDELDEQVEHDEVVAVGAPPKRFAVARHHLVAAELHQEAAHVLHHVAQRAVASVRLHLALILDSGVGDGADGDARLLVKETPEGSRQVEQDGLTGEDQRHPLVVPDKLAFLALLRNAVLIEGQVVRIRCPAHLQHDRKHRQHRICIYLGSSSQWAASHEHTTQNCNGYKSQH